MDLIQLIYVSVSKTFMTATDLMDILDKSRKNNRPRNVTGVLLYQNGFFVQVLEGQAADVDAIYQKIENDARHGHVKVIDRSAIQQRGFPTWSMGFTNLDELTGEDATALREFLQTPLDTDIVTDRPEHVFRLVERVKALQR